MIKIAIVEDEVEMINALKSQLQRFLSEKKVAFDVETFSTAVSLLENYNNCYDLIFMDINLPMMDGMSAAEKIRELDSSVMLIFVTSLAQYAIKGYQVQAFDYIVKPLQYQNLVLTMTRALPHLNHKEESIVITDNKRVMNKIMVEDIRYIETADHLLRFHVKDKVIDTYDSLKNYVEKLSPLGFASCNRCYLVNLKHVSAIEQYEVIVDEDRLLISRPKRKEFISALNLYMSSGGNP